MNGGREKVCPICGKHFTARANAQRYCGRACVYASQRKENSELRRMKKDRKADAAMVSIKITKHIRLFQELIPMKGKVYQALRCAATQSEPFYIIPDIGGKKIVVRADECVEV